VALGEHGRDMKTDEMGEPASTPGTGLTGELHALREALLHCQAELQNAQQALAASQLREARARYAASTDSLTGLPNRLAFDHRSTRTLATHTAAARTFCLLFIDLDGFKSVNDLLGHAAGDALLKVVGARLAHALRGDDFVSRHGGDEFVCLLPDVQGEVQAVGVARKLMASVAAPCRVGAHTVQVKASVGVALFPQDARNLADLLDAADHAMLWAKARGVGLGLARETLPGLAALRASIPTSPRTIPSSAPAAHAGANPPA
jgi:diguanylate cyclase (GGDEF)-like protein